MLKKFTFTLHHDTHWSPLLALLLMVVFSTANAQSSGSTPVETPNAIKNTGSAGGATTNAAGASSANSSGLCERPEQWLYAETYEKGELTFHGSKVWKALKTTKGDMPGMNTPPFWEAVDDHCSMADQ
ncbi:hypothetical protein GCM10011533_13850 [Streptosporangium jomthongense]|uniref:Chitin-binding type-3 domain-containing protein n=1 Tax=Marinobacter aromaticivorans TaxID=1494078 RepID=A0ABW2ITV4_9GAMM|nr:hypothetical protein [Marinobacter aromaticivorans]GGE62612.1 hypothetical protein GCM10011533_13850 [Streptosporangium jomthongense]